MKYKEKKALAIIKAHKLKPATLRVWKLRGNIPDKYAEKEERIALEEVLPTDPIDTAVEKYGDELIRLLETRRFRPGQNDSYYRTCLYSLCREVKTWQETGKLS